MVFLSRKVVENNLGGNRGEMKELLSTSRFLAYATSIWWVELIMRKRSLEEGQVLGENHEFSWDIISLTFT